jgi:predicted MFS family arabinose efflux permease
MNNMSEENFLAAVADPARRSTAIARLSKRRTMLSWTVCILTLGFFAFCLASKPPDSFAVFMLLVLWMFLFGCESDLRLLRVIERLKSNEKPAS